MGRSMQRLSSGLRINSALDDAAGLAISSKMTSQVRGLNQAVRNANDAISMIQVAEGATQAVTDMLQRMRELAVQAVNDSNTDSDRSALRAEFTQLVAEIGRISNNTQWNGTQLLDGSTYANLANFQIGSNADQAIAVELADLSQNSASSVFGTDLSSITETIGLNDANSQTQYVMVKQQEGKTKRVFLSEIKVMSDGVNVALNKTVAQNASIATNHSASGGALLVDGHSHIAQNGFKNVKATSDVWIQIDLGQAYRVDSVSIHSIRDGAQNPRATNHLTTFISANSMLDSSGNPLPHADLLAGDNTALGVRTAGTTKKITADNPSETLYISQESALNRIDNAIANLNTYRSTLGASQNRMEYAADNLTNIAQNTHAARSRILDADYALESTELVRTQILQQAATAMLAQANIQAQVVTSLLP